MYRQDALARVAAVAAAEDAALVYADEISATDGLSSLKPDWSPDFLLSTDYVGRAVFYKKSWAEKAGGITAEVNRASLYDLALRVTEIGPTPVHLPFTFVKPICPTRK